MSSENTLQLELNLEKDKIGVNDTNTHIVATIRNKEEWVNVGGSTKQRIIIVLDKSGSMYDHFNTVKITVEFICTQLKSTDELAIVVYSDDADVLVPFTLMNEFGKKVVIQEISTIFTNGSTNMSSAINKSLDLFKNLQVTSSDDNLYSNSILFLTDGHANRGITNCTELITFIQNKLKNISVDSQSINLFTFGFGDNYNTELLANISDISTSGSHYHINNEDEIAGIFGTCLGGLLSIVALDTKLVIRHNGNKLGKVYDKIKYSAITDVTTIEQGDMYSEETRDFLIKLELTSIDSECIVELSYTNTLGIEEKVEKTIKFEHSDNEINDINPYVLSNKIRIRYIETLDIACNQLIPVKERKYTVQEVIKYIKSIEENNRYIPELEQLFENLNKEEQNSTPIDNKRYASLQRMESQQRSNTCTNNNYSTPTQDTMRIKSNEYTSLTDNENSINTTSSCPKKPRI